MKKEYLLYGKWEAVKLVRPDMVYHFFPGEWELEFSPDRKIRVYCKYDPVGEFDYTFRDDLLTIGGGIAKKIVLTGTLLVVHETDPDSGMQYYTLYRPGVSGFVTC